MPLFQHRDHAHAIDRAKTPTVLMVEDHDQFAAVIARWMVEDGFDVEVVSTIAAAKLAVKRHCPDLLVLDLTLPNGDGLMVVDDVVPICPHVPFIIVTGHHDDALAIAAIIRGADDVLYKGTKHLREDLTRRMRFSLYRNQRRQGTALAVDAETEHRLYQRRTNDRREDRNNRLGWACFALAVMIFAANIAADLVNGTRPSFSLTTAGICAFFGTLAVALTQGVKVKPNEILGALLRRQQDPPA